MKTESDKKSGYSSKLLENYQHELTDFLIGCTIYYFLTEKIKMIGESKPVVCLFRCDLVTEFWT